MARIKLSGIFDNALSGLPCLRGYAEMQTLKDISKAPRSYQRDKDKRQMDLITTYLKSGEHLFFPEIILACTLPSFDADKNINTFTTLREKLSFKLKNFSISFLKSGIANVSIDSQIILSRIDGNHRLSAFKETDVVATLQAPFCIVFLPEDEVGQKSEAIYFYNINFKHLPLKQEHSLKILINPDLNFTDKELKDMGWEFYFTRVLCKRIEDEAAFQSLKILSVKSDCYRSAIFNLCVFLIDKKIIKQNNKDFQNISAAINKISDVYENFGGFKGSIGLLSSLVYFELSENKISKAFKRWILANHIYKINKIDAVDLVEVFERIIKAKSRQIFVSMEFGDPTLQNYKAIKNAVDDINKECNLKLKLRQIRMDKFKTGYSYQINKEILKLIEECGLFIADLTKGNKNVYHEIGYLMGLNKGWGLPQENFILLHNDSIGNTKDDIGFNLKSIKQLRVSDTDDLREQIKEHIKIYYGL